MVHVEVKYDEAQLEKESTIFKCPDKSRYMKAVNEASLALVKENGTLLKNKGELFNLAKQKVHDLGYQYAKKTSRSKNFGESSSANAEVPKKRKYMSSSIRQNRITELSESIKSTGETIQLLLKQKEQYININKFQQAADVNSTILEKTTEKQKLERELKSLQQVGEKLKKYKKKKHSKDKDENRSQHNSRQKKLSWKSSSSNSNSSAKDGESSGADTLILSDSEDIGVHTVVLSDSSPVLSHDSPDENVLKEDEVCGSNDELSPPSSQVPRESGLEQANFCMSPK